jgi:hypothetical protein
MTAIWNKNLLPYLKTDNFDLRIRQIYRFNKHEFSKRRFSQRERY